MHIESVDPTETLGAAEQSGASDTPTNDNPVPPTRPLEPLGFGRADEHQYQILPRLVPGEGAVEQRGHITEFSMGQPSTQKIGMDYSRGKTPTLVKVFTFWGAIIPY